MPDKALSGTRVLEYAQFVAGPYCAKLMADLGAEVIKIEPPEGDVARRRGPFPNDIPHPERSGLFLYNNTNKSGITLNLDSTEGKEIFRRLIKDIDIFVEDTPPGMMKKLGLDYAALKEINPRLIMTSITPFGQTGPYKDYKAYYLNLSHGSGLGYTTPYNPLDPHILEREPVMEGALIGEYDSGLFAAVATLSALYLCVFTGRGQHIDVSKQEVLLHHLRVHMANYFDDGHWEHRADKDMLNAWGGVFPCKDGYIYTIFIEDQQWRGLVDLMGNPQWSKEEKFSPEKRRELRAEEVYPLLMPWIAEHTREEIFHGLQNRGCPACPVYKVGEVPHTEHMKARGFFVDLEHPEAGRLSYPSGLAKFS
ncbi:MAG: CoA transferase, partial [Dehalococcoidia bacterium]|nr:CoA transferase [Dehalococcoidia bacterium]